MSAEDNGGEIMYFFSVSDITSLFQTVFLELYGLVFCFTYHFTISNSVFVIIWTGFLFQISLHWLKQCFWNYMDWSDICHYIVICLVMGVDYQVYICVAIFKHLQREIMSRLQTQDLIMLLKVR